MRSVIRLMRGDTHTHTHDRSKGNYAVDTIKLVDTADTSKHD